MTNPVFTDKELVDDANNYGTRRAWKSAGVLKRLAGGYSPYGAALHRGREFMAKCCAHMPDERGGFRGRKYSDADLIASARDYQTRGAWKRGSVNMYQSARMRPIWDECVAHMRPAANPFAKDYVVYAEEFSDGFCYVGLSCVPENRKTAHACRGPVYDHAQQTDLVPIFKILESELLYTAVGSAEDCWQQRYSTDGWKALHTAKAGCLGGIHKSKWTREAVLAEARKFVTKQAWIDGSQMSYRIAKREGWFDEASAHMPKRDPASLIGRKVSAATRRKQGLAKQGKNLTEAHRAKISDGLRRHWNPPA